MTAGQTELVKQVGNTMCLCGFEFLVKVTSEHNAWLGNRRSRHHNGPFGYERALHLKTRSLGFTLLHAWYGGPPAPAFIGTDLAR